jgi:transcriptional regulator with XRE-family HTH domain
VIEVKFIGDNIRKFRSEINLTREDLAKKIKKNGNKIVSRTIINWETGESKPDADSLAQMSEIFQKDLILFFIPIAYQSGLINTEGSSKPVHRNLQGKNAKKGHCRMMSNPRKTA